MTETLLIRQATIIDPSAGKEAVADVRIDDGIIGEIGADLRPRENEAVIEAKELWLTPGLIDIHTHLRDLGQKDKEDMETGTRAAAAGGYTTVVAMANTDPPVDNGATLSVLMSRIAQKAVIEVLPVAAVTKGLAGAELTNMAELADVGAVAFSDDGMTVSNLAVLRRALDYAKLTGRVVISHAEDRDLSAGGAITEGATATMLGLRGIPTASETAAVAREIEIVRITDTPYHFTHISCARSVELIRRAKRDAMPITADVTPHHLTLTIDEMKGYDTCFKMKPPLQHEADQQALAEGLRDGTIDAIATDHAPHTRLEKVTTMDDSAVGILGLETAFALCNERLVGGGILSPIQLIALFTTKPAAVLNLPAPTLERGAAANLALIDPKQKWIYDPRHGMSKSHNSPYKGRTLTGKNLLTIYRGKPVYRDAAALQERTKTSVSGGTHG